MSVFEHHVSCADVAPLLVFYVCDEVSEKERKQIEAHLAGCAACAAQVVEERELQEAMIAGLQPADELDSAGILLAQCRSELAESSTIFPRRPCGRAGGLLAGCAAGWLCGRPGAALLWSSSGSSSAHNSSPGCKPLIQTTQADKP